jgi:hypothetical protein
LKSFGIAFWHHLAALSQVALKRLITLLQDDRFWLLKTNKKKNVYSFTLKLIRKKNPVAPTVGIKNIFNKRELQIWKQ